MRTWTCGALILIGSVMIGASPAAAQPDIQSIVPETAAAGFGQLITIQGFGLIADGDIGQTTVTFTDSETGSVCSDVFAYASPSTANELYVRLPPSGGACDIRVGKHKVTVSTVAGISNAVLFQVKQKPHAPIPRRVGLSGVVGCPTSPIVPPVGPPIVFDICIQASGTDTSGVEAIFSRNGIEYPPQPLAISWSNSTGLINGFAFPAGLGPGPVLVQLRTTVNGTASDLSFALVLVVP